MAELIHFPTKYKNPYMEYMIPVIEAFNAPHNRDPHPFEALAIANILRYRSLTWNEGAFDQSARSGMLQEKCCSCTSITGATEPPECCGPCGQPKANITSFDSITQAANAVRIKNAYTPMVKTFEQKISAMGMNQSNAWIYFQQMIDAFYEHVSFVTYFANEYMDGKYPFHFLSTMGADYRPGYESSGLVVGTISQGDVAGTSGYTDVDFASISLGQEGSYYSVFMNATNRAIIWFDIGGATAPVKAPIANVTDTYIHVISDFTTSPADFATNVFLRYKEAILTAAASITQPTGTSVRITTKFLGSRVASDFTNMTPEWPSAFVDGVDGGSVGNELTGINFNNVVVNKLNGRYFTMYNGTDSYIFWYNTGHAVEPSEIATGHIEIILEGGDLRTVRSATDAAIKASGFWSRKALCTDALGNTHPEPCALGPDDLDFSSNFSYWENVDSGTHADADGGTAQVGGGSNLVTTIYGADGTELATGLVDSMDYARANNNLKVPYDAGKGITSPYLKPVHSLKAGGIPDCCPSCPTLVCPLEDFDLMMKTRYLSITDDIPFNTPGTNFITENEPDCPDCFM